MRLITLFSLFILLSAAEASAFEGVEWGPEITAALPQPIEVGAAASCSLHSVFCRSDLKYFVDGGFLRLPFLPADRIASISSIEFGARFLPFRVPIYLAGAFGYRHITYAANVSSFKIGEDATISTGSIDLSTIYFSPRVGADLHLSTHLNLGFDVGYQIPLIHYGSLYLVNNQTGANSTNSPQLNTNSSEPMSILAGRWIPEITFLRLSWMM
jgi:hypothetical protein